MTDPRPEPPVALPRRVQVVVDRFVGACRDDERVVAAFLGGSHARGTADAHSDLDLGLITTDHGYEDFIAEREAFVRRLGDLLFLEDFDLPDIVFFVLSDGTEGELALARAGRFHHVHLGPYRVLLDKTGLLAGAVFTGSGPAPAEQVETLRRLICWFWHDVSHFTAAMARGELWWAYGQLEQLRRSCVNLARLAHDFAARADGYDKLEHAIPAAEVSSLAATLCPLEAGPMYRAALSVIAFYRERAPRLARAHGVPYPEGLERVMCDRLEQLGDAR